MKNDFRLQYPLWMMGFIIVLGFFAYGLSSPITEMIEMENETSITVSIGGVGGMFLAVSMIGYLLMLVVFAWQLKKHNKQNPNQRISPISIRPPEYLEQDEGMTYITRKAAQKVYTFITWGLPLLALSSSFRCRVFSSFGEFCCSHLANTGFTFVKYVSI